MWWSVPSSGRPTTEIMMIDWHSISNLVFRGEKHPLINNENGRNVFNRRDESYHTIDILKPLAVNVRLCFSLHQNLTFTTLMLIKYLMLHNIKLTSD